MINGKDGADTAAVVGQRKRTMQGYGASDANAVLPIFLLSV